MSIHSYARIWLHLAWSTLARESVLSEDASLELERHLVAYGADRGITMRSVYAGADHAHAVIELPTNLTVEQVLQLFKGESSHWLNLRSILSQALHWGRGYGAFSVSEELLEEVIAFIESQKEYHTHTSFEEEFRELVRKHGLAWSGWSS